MKESRRRHFIVASALIYATCALLCAFPAFILGFGIQALGATLNIWQGDPNSNDGEEVTATVIGLASCAVLILLAGLLTQLSGKYCNVRAAPGILAGTVMTILVLIAFCVWVFSSPG